MKYIDLVLCRDPDNAKRVWLYQAPKFSKLKPEDEVCVMDCNGNERVATVLQAIAISDESDEFNFIMALNELKEPLKIIGKYNYSKFVYADGEDGDADDKG